MREHCAQAAKQREYKHTISPINRVVIAIIIQIGSTKQWNNHTQYKSKKMFWTFSIEFLFHTNTTIGIFFNIIMQHGFFFMALMMHLWAFFELIIIKSALILTAAEHEAYWVRYQLLLNIHILYPVDIIMLGTRERLCCVTYVLHMMDF